MGLKFARFSQLFTLYLSRFAATAHGGFILPLCQGENGW